MDLENLRWHISEKGYLNDDVIEKLYKRIDTIKENNRIVKEQVQNGTNTNNR